MAGDLTKALASLEKTIKARQAEEGDEGTGSAEMLPAVHLQFPLPFGEDTRAAANAMLRGSLFAPIKTREHFADYVTVADFPRYCIEFKGQQFNQDDHDVLMQLVKMARHKQFGLDVVQAVNAVLKGMGRSTQQEQRRQLFEQVDRLVSGTVRVSLPGSPRYAGHILDDASTPQDQKTEPRFRRHLAYRLNPKFARFYSVHAYTLIDTKIRQAIKGRGSELAKWLQLIIESHVDFYPTKVATLHQDSRSKDASLKSFRQKLRQALALLEEAGVIVAWLIDPATDLVSIQRIPSNAQQRHIIRKRKAIARG